jgi:23S rRNA G2445 N2-methylase RlmL
LEPPEPSGLLLANPPYGLRLAGEPEAYRALGAALRGPFGRWRWGVVVARKEMERVLALAPKERHPFRNGGLRTWLATGGPETP